MIRSLRTWLCAGLILFDPLLSLASQEPVSISPMHTQAIALYRAKRYAEAAPLYRQLAIQMPNNPDILQDLLWTLWYAEKYDEVTWVAAQITSLNTDDSAVCT